MAKVEDKGPRWQGCLVFLIAVATFSGTFTGDFVFDDSEALVNNLDLRPSTPLSNIFRNDFWGTRLTSNTSHKSYRPLTILVYRLISHMDHGELHASHFHGLNILLYGTVCLLVYRVALTIFPGQAALLCALLFTVHPIHTESVSAIVGCADLLSAHFYLLALLVYLRWSPSVTAGVSQAGMTVLLAGTSMFCKEQGITVLGVCFLHELTRSLESRPVLKNGSLPRLAVLAAGGGVLLAIRLTIMGPNPPTFRPEDNPASFLPSYWLRALNYNYIWALNSWLLVHPLWLCFDWSMGCVPVLEGPGDLRVLAVVLHWITLAIVAVRGFKPRPALRLGLALLAMPFLPASNLFFRVGFVVAERALFLPSLGFCLLVTIGVQQLVPCYPKVVRGSLVGLLIVFFLRSLQRSADWHSEYSLFHSGLKVCPLNAKVHYNLAKNRADLGERELAIQEYRAALRLHPDYDQAMNNLANILKEAGQLEEARALLLRAVSLRPDFAAAWMNLGIVQAGLNQTAQAEVSYLTALKHRQRYPDCLYNLGNLFLAQGRFQEALEAWRNATLLKPSHLVAWTNMVILLDSQGDMAQAESVAREALKILPQAPSLHFHLANCLGKTSRFQEAELHFSLAVEGSPDNPTYYANFGVLYHRWGHAALALRHYRHALALKPDLSSARANMALLLRTYPELDS